MENKLLEKWLETIKTSSKDELEKINVKTYKRRIKFEKLNYKLNKIKIN